MTVEDHPEHRLGSDESFYSALAGDRRTHSSESHSLSEEGFTEELNVNWCLLALRIMSLVLVAGVVITYGLGELDSRLVLLGAILAAAAVACLIVSFFDCFKQRFFVSQWTDMDEVDGVGTKSVLIEGEKFIV